MLDGEKNLPVIQDDVDTGEPSCSPKIYVSNEEAALLDAMRDLRRQSLELKHEMRDAEPQRSAEIESEIAALRAQWKRLANQREKAFVRKMIMLGHLPPSAEPG